MRRRLEELRVEVGVKESFKKKLDMWKMKKLQREQMPRKLREREARKTENSMEGPR